MRFARNAFGIAAIVLLVTGANLLALHETLFTASVATPFAAAALLGIVWFVLWLVTLGQRQSASSGGLINAVVSSMFLLGIFIVLYAFVARADWSRDLTAEGRRELAPQTKLVLESLTQPVDVICFFVKAGDDRVRTAQDKTRRFLDQCQQYTDQLAISFIDPAEHPEQVQKYGVIGTKKSQVGSILLTSGSRHREIPLSTVNARLEERDFTNSLINVSRNAVPKIYFLMGHGGWDLQSDDPKQGGKKFTALLAHESYELAALSISPDAPTVPSDCSVLLINGFTDDLREDEVAAIDQYVNDGGRFMILMNPLYQQQSAVPMVERLRPWLDNRFGVRLPSNVLVSTETGGYQIAFLPDFSVFPNFEEDPSNQQLWRGSFNGAHPITRGMDKQMVMSFVRSVESAAELPDGVTHTPLLRSTPGTWAETDLDAVMSQKPISMDPGETGGPNPVALAVTAQAGVDVANESRPRESRGVIVGNAYLTTNDTVVIAGVQDFLLNSLAWLTESEELIAIRPRTDRDEPLVLTRDQQRLIAWIASLGTVQAVALLGVVVFVWRRKYR